MTVILTVFLAGVPTPLCAVHMYSPPSWRLTFYTTWVQHHQLSAILNFEFERQQKIQIDVKQRKIHNKILDKKWKVNEVKWKITTYLRAITTASVSKVIQNSEIKYNMKWSRKTRNQMKNFMYIQYVVTRYTVSRNFLLTLGQCGPIETRCFWKSSVGSTQACMRRSERSRVHGSTCRLPDTRLQSSWTQHKYVNCH